MVDLKLVLELNYPDKPTLFSGTYNFDFAFCWLTYM